MHDDLPMCFLHQRPILMDELVSAQDNGGNFPPDLAALKIPTEEGCPEWQKPHNGLGIGYNIALSNLYIGDIERPSEMLVIADAKSDVISSRRDIDETRHLVEIRSQYYWYIRREPQFYAALLTVMSKR